ncbi:hypothetical protein WR25_05418 [Diploscapter pachys]|uniref:Uncharacterized protein n=1 Tax=Diploscapter pachys TaxID=2018661 RepID=A0A2A2KAG8_9BILA|nr:hypothetical protein WR25_05418 [Diploscapter pachys]
MALKSAIRNPLPVIVQLEQAVYFSSPGFVWELLETSRFDRIPAADRRLLYASELPANYEDITEENQVVNEDLEGDRQSEAGALSIASGSRSNNEAVLQRFSRIRSSSRGRGLFGIRSGCGREGVVRRSSVKSGESCLSRVASSCSNNSASLRIVFETNEHWDDEFADQNQIIPVSFQMSPNNQQEAASIGDLGSVFDDVLSVASGLENPHLDLNAENEKEEESDLMRIKCMTDSKYMYQSVIVAGSEMGSEAGSILGGSPGSIRSVLSNALSLRKKAFNSKKEGSPQGLWQLTQKDKEKPSTSSENQIDPMKSPDMTDSGFTRSTYSKKSQNRSMFDSAIGADLLSSDEGSVHNEGENNKRRLNSLYENDASSIAPSEMSLEWFDDGLRSQDLLLSENAPSGSKDDGKVQVEGLDWDLEERSQKSERSNKSAISFGSNQIISISPLHKPIESRDLMVLACELFQPYSKHFKMLSLILSSALYHRCELLRDNNWQNLEKRFNETLRECDFLRKWPKRTEKAMRQQLKELCNLAKAPSLSPITVDHVKGLQLLLVLEAKRVYDEKLAGLSGGLDWFNVDSPAAVLQLLHSGGNLSDSLLFPLLVRCCKFSAEIVDVQQKNVGVSNNSTNQANFYGLTARRLETCLTFLHHSGVTVPLFYVPDE